MLGTKVSTLLNGNKKVKVYDAMEVRGEGGDKDSRERCCEDGHASEGT